MEPGLSNSESDAMALKSDSAAPFETFNAAVSIRQARNYDAPLASSEGLCRSQTGNLEHLNATQVRVMTILDGPIVKPLVCCVILLNAIQVVYETDVGSRCQYDEDQSACDQEAGWLLVMNWIYLAIYSIELAFRIYCIARTA